MKMLKKQLPNYDKINNKLHVKQKNFEITQPNDY